MPDNPRIEELRRRVQTDPASIAFAALAEEYRRAGRYEEAIATCEGGLQRHPAYLSARVTLGRALLELERYDDAREHLQEVLRVAPENLAAIRALAEIHNRRGNGPGSHESNEPAAVPVAVPPSQPIAVFVQEPAVAPVESVASWPDVQAGSRMTAAEDSPPVAPSSSGDASVLTELESFLNAIVRARDALHSGDGRR